MLPKKLTGSAEMISVTPKILMLLSGKIGFREIRVQQPDVTITLQKSLEEEKTPAKSPAVGDLMRQIVSVFATSPALQLPDVDGYIENGRLKLMVDSRAAVELDHVEARLTNAAGSLTFQVTGTSNRGRKRFHIRHSGYTGIEGQRPDSADPTAAAGHQRHFFPGIFLEDGGVTR